MNTAVEHKATWRDYYELCKPKVVALMLLTALVGMHLAVPGSVDPALICFALLGIGTGAGAAAVVNHIVDRQIDAIMARTERRPVATGRVSPVQALTFALVLATFSMWILCTFVNTLTAMLTMASLVGYAGVYTLFLKRTTPQNIVIGGASGAAPPLLGWVAVTGHVDVHSLLLALIIFVWTPPHFWALAIARRDEYAKAKIPMLPVTHGVAYTKLNILLYSILLFVVSLLPFVCGLSGWLYAVGATILGAGFLYYSAKLWYSKDEAFAMPTFRYSIYYLMMLFSILLIDHYTVAQALLRSH